MKRVLLTGMSGTGKSTLIIALTALGYKAVDLDCDEYSRWVAVAPSTTLTPEPDRDWVWRVDRVQELLSTGDSAMSEDGAMLFVCGCAENMGQFYPQFDHVILLSAPPQIIIERLATRTNNPFGKRPEQVAQVLTLQEIIEPLLREKADYEIDTSKSLDQVLADLLGYLKSTGENP